MRRRTIIAATGLAVLTGGAGCLDGVDGSGGEEEGEQEDGTATPGETDHQNGLEDRVRDCEEQFIREEIVTGADEHIDGPLAPAIVERRPGEAGEFLEVRTEFGVTRETDDGPDEHLDYAVAAIYLVGDDVYRTEGTDADGDPGDGIRVDC